MQKTQEQILNAIIAARDSVWVIEDTIEKLNGGESPSLELKSNIDRNVSHLKIIVADQEIVGSGEDITDLESAILTGEAKLSENIWPT